MSATTPAPPTIHARLEHLQRVYSLVTFLNWFAALLPSAVIVLFAQSRGLGLADVGLYVAVYSATAALLELPTGNLADVVGRKRVALLGFCLAALARLALLCAFSLPGFLVYAVLWGLARALGSGALEAWFVNRVREIDPEATLQPRLARINTVELLALGVGSLLGAALPPVAKTLLSSGAGLFSPLSIAILASLLMHLVTLTVAWRVVHEAPRPHASLLAALREGLTGLPGVLLDVANSLRQNALLSRLLLLEAVVGVVLAASETYWQPFFAGRFGLGGSNTLVFGGLLAGCYLAGMLGNLCSERLLRLFGQRLGQLGVLVQLVQAVAFLALAWQGAVWLAAGLFWLTYFARTVFSSPFLALYNAQVPDERRSLMLSVLSVAMFVGSSVGNVALGVVSSHFSIAWAWTLTAGVLVLSLAVIPRLRSGRNQEGPFTEA